MVNYLKFTVFFLAFMSASAIVSVAQVSQDTQSSDAQIAHGAYLVDGLGHCGSCHTPRGIGYQELAYTADDPKYLSGAEIDGWYANSLRTLNLTHEEIVSLLARGFTDRKGLAGSMKEVVTYSTQYLTQEDLESIAAYLLSIQLEQPATPAIHASVTEPDPQAAFLYFTYCSTCHGEQGQGMPNAVPSLVGNSNVVTQNPMNLIRIVLNGEQTPPTIGLKPLDMPAYRETLTAEEVVLVLNYIRNSWGNQAEPVSVKQIEKLLE